jgi:deoxycytidine triphosphate deaminase
MILSDKTIRQYIDEGKISIFPEFQAGDIRPTGIRLHLGKELLIPVSGQKVDLASRDEIKFERVTIPSEGFVLRPNQFF